MSSQKPERYRPTLNWKIYKTRKFFLVNISPSIQEKDLEDLFKRYGEIKKIKIWNGKAYRCGTLNFKRCQNVLRIQADISGTLVGGEVLLVAPQKTYNRLYREEISDRSETSCSEICVYGYRYFKRDSDFRRINRFIWRPTLCRELKSMNGPKEEGEKNWEYRRWYREIDPYIRDREIMSWPVVFRYRLSNSNYIRGEEEDTLLNEYYDSIPSQLGKWFPNDGYF